MPVSPLLQEIRANSGEWRTQGLPDDVLDAFAATDHSLVVACQEALALHRRLRLDEPELAAMDEADLIPLVQEGLLNFYKPETVNPYVALAAKGPWIVSTHGAVVHDNGGYGMLGQGHNPDDVTAQLGKPHVMANVMTANLSQRSFNQKMRRELGHSREGGCPFHKFICLNSGSEAVTVATRLADINAKRQTGSGGAHEGKTIKALAIEGGFHGRTGRPARVSDSCREAYEKNLATFANHDDLVIVKQNDCDMLRQVFAKAEREGWFFEAMYMEPVQGEGAPGRALTREFYDLSVALVWAMGGLVVVDSIQAGLRAHGVLSIIDYPGFQQAPVPDVETWSKALNAGQFPLSVLGLSRRAAELYVKGVYGNTMTTNPRGLDVACAVLDAVTPQVRANIARQGDSFLTKLRQVQRDFPDVVVSVDGTGLLFCAELHPDIPVVGFGSPEERCRVLGLGVVHGGRNALRFTPHFGITDAEVDMVIGVLRTVLAEVRAALAA